MAALLLSYYHIPQASTVTIISAFFENSFLKEKVLYEKLRLPISELELSVRSSNCLREANIKTIADLVKRTEAELLGYRNFGKKSLSEINELLKGMGLALGMKVDMKKLRKKE